MTQIHDEAPAQTKRISVSGRAGRRGLFAQVMRFFREVIAELAKVVWPSRKELITYTTVVVIFVSIMVAVVAALDLAFTKGVLAVFG